MIDYSPVKVLIYRSIGFRIGKGVYISPDVILDPQFPRFVEIGDHVVLGWGSKIFVHDYDGVVYRIGRVKIGAGSVIGGFSFIRAGVTIPENSLVKLGSRILVGDSRDVVPLAELKAKFESQNRSDIPADTQMRQQ
jgi:acetyltransferase-like isoleucine patch superfamily enzyme